MDVGRLLSGITLAVVAGVSAAQAQDVQLVVDHAAARVVVVPEARTTLLVSVHQGASRLPQLQVRQEGRRIVVEGGLHAGGFHSARCTGGLQVGRLFGGGRLLDTRAVEVGGVGRVAYADLPVITVHAPMAVRITVGPAVYGVVGRTESLGLDLDGCGDWTLEDVHANLSVNLAGSGDVHAGGAGAMSARLAGSGDLSAGQVAQSVDLDLSGAGDASVARVGGPLHVQVSGSGDIVVGRASGPVRASIAASGDVRIRAGHAPVVSVAVAGSGDFDFNGSADGLTASVEGSGDVHVAHVAGAVEKSVQGSGEVSVGP